MPLSVGHAGVVITPTESVQLAGYYYPRESRGVHDDLTANALVADDGVRRVVLVSADVIHIPDWMAAETRLRIGEALGTSPEAVFINASHCHTGPGVDSDYGRRLPRKFAEAARLAGRRLRPVALAVAKGELHGLSFNRRYWMKDGTLVTNPGKGNPDVVRPAGRYDPELLVLRFVTDEGPDCCLVNFALHPDTVGGDLISADWPGVVRRLLQEHLGAGTTVLFANGAAGDVNHWDLADLSPQRGIEEAERIGAAVAARAQALLAEATPVAVPHVHSASTRVTLPYQPFTEEDKRAAEAVLARPIDYAHDFTLEVVHAHKVMNALTAPAPTRITEVQAVSFGDVALVGLPGEVFTELGLSVKQSSPFPTTLFAELANDNIGYVPSCRSFAEGGYEVTSCPFTPGFGEDLAAAGLELLRRVRDE